VTIERMRRVGSRPPVRQLHALKVLSTGIVLFAIWMMVSHPASATARYLTAASSLAALLSFVVPVRSKAERTGPIRSKPGQQDKNGRHHRAAATALEVCLALVIAAVLITATSVTYHWIHDRYRPVRVVKMSRMLWFYKTGGAIEGRPAVADGRVFVGSADNSVYGISLTGDHHAWIYSTAGEVLSSPVAVGGVVYVGSTDGNFYALNASTGQPIWVRHTGAVAYSSPIVSGAMVYIGAYQGDKGMVYGFGTAHGTRRWVTVVDGNVKAGLAIADGKIYVGTLTNTVYALNASTGHVDWTFQAHGGIWSAPVMAGGFVYVGSGDCNVYALNAMTGHKKWSYGLSNWIKGSPAFADGMLYIGDINAANSELYAISAADAGHVWTFPIGHSLYSSPTVALGVLYVGGQNDRLYAISTATHQLLWSFPTDSAIESSPVVAGQTRGTRLVPALGRA
jgi:eukaryotic-like serine/threonine-protein kinase